MIKVKLLRNTEGSPLELASHAALECYQEESPQMGSQIDVKNRLFLTGHHTTLQHFYFTFNIEGISVGDITTGMHLVSPFYTSDQRSGRFCAKMFLKPDYKRIALYIDRFWDVNNSSLKEIIEYVKKGVTIFHENIEKATRITKKLLKKERPLASERYINTNAGKIAQEQLRMVIPIIFPTGFDFTVNETALVAMYRTAWTPPMKEVTRQMIKLVLQKYPELKFMFESASELDIWDGFVSLSRNFSESGNLGNLRLEPYLEIIHIEGDEKFVSPDPKHMHPVDLLPFMPKYMNNSVGSIKTRVKLSIATMGQDQRHRTIKRGNPIFTGRFYLPPVPYECNLKMEFSDLFSRWVKLKDRIPEALFAVLAPYGAQVEYTKSGDFNAIAHEQSKRLCFCAQEEIYNLSRLFREEIRRRRCIKSHSRNLNPDLLKIFEPYCYKTGKCAEGARYCGRRIYSHEIENENYFPRRKV
jgi:thymidylate synthase ThyX